MKVEINNTEVIHIHEINYPWLGISERDSYIVYFINDKTGILLNEEGYNKCLLDHWSVECFRPFIGSITLSNDE